MTRVSPFKPCPCLRLCLRVCVNGLVRSAQYRLSNVFKRFPRVVQALKTQGRPRLRQFGRQVQVVRLESQTQGTHGRVRRLNRGQVACATVRVRARRQQCASKARVLQGDSPMKKPFVSSQPSSILLTLRQTRGRDRRVKIRDRKQTLQNRRLGRRRRIKLGGPAGKCRQGGAACVRARAHQGHRIRHRAIESQRVVRQRSRPKQSDRRGGPRFWVQSARKKTSQRGKSGKL